jgi:hypothetical protein
MKVITQDCPHCLQLKSQFNFIKAVKLRKIKTDDDGNYEPVIHENKFACLWTCVSCGEGISGVIEITPAKGNKYGILKIDEGIMCESYDFKNLPQTSAVRISGTCLG